MYPALHHFLLTYWPDIIALITGVAGVWLTIKQNILCWPMALISVVVSAVVFYEQRLYGDMLLQAVYFVAGIYGWIYWKQNLKKEFRVSNTRTAAIPGLVVATILQAIIYSLVLKFIGGDRPFFDAFLTAASLTATYMMTKKWVENWAVWVVIDGTYILLYGLKHMWFFGLLYLIFTIIAFYGWLKWRKTAAL